VGLGLGLVKEGNNHATDLVIKTHCTEKRSTTEQSRWHLGQASAIESFWRSLEQCTYAQRALTSAIAVL